MGVSIVSCDYFLLCLVNDNITNISDTKFSVLSCIVQCANCILFSGAYYITSVPHSKLSVLACIHQCGESCSSSNSIDNIINEDKWKWIEEKLLDWKLLDKFGIVYN